MIKLSFVAVNYSYGPKLLNAYQIPYSAGCLWTYVEHVSEIVRDNYQFEHLLWRRTPIDEACEQLKDQDIVCFSSYIWNKNYSYTLAKKLKDINPDITIIFGGPEPPVTDINFFLNYPYIDYVVLKEGEEVFKELLESFVTGTEPETVKGLLINHKGNTVNTGEAERLQTLDNLPSPYLTGFFDKIIADNPDVKWSAIFETNRGCPYQCTFCDWGSLTYSKFRKFELERCIAELEWFGKNQMDFVYIADSNFGVFYDRDMAIAEKLADVMSTYNHPKDFNLTWAKNQNAKIIDIVKMFMKSGYNKGLTISTQSMDSEVLTSIKRKNMGINKIADLYKMCEQNSIPLNTELILGLPDETLETWKNNFYSLYEAGNHRGIAVYPALLLENAEMNLTQRDEYDMHTVLFPIEANGTDDGIPEGVATVMATKDMPLDIMKEAIMFTSFLYLMHTGGISTWISRFLVKYLDISYADFYNGLWEKLKLDPWVAEKVSHISSRIDKVIELGHGYEPFDIVGEFKVGALTMYHTLRFWAVYELKELHVFDLVKQYVKDCYDLPEELYTELMDFQENLIINFERQSQYPINSIYNYNFYQYIIQDNVELHEATSVTFDNRNQVQDNMHHYIQKLMYNRRAYFGTADVINTQDDKNNTQE